MKKLSKKQRKVIKILALIIMFIYNLAFSCMGFVTITLGELWNYALYDLGFNASYHPTFSTPEIWGWYAIISTIVLLIAFITYIVLNIKELIRNGVTKKLCIKNFIFTLIYTFLQLLPLIINKLYR